MEALGGAFARAEDVELDRSLYGMIELEGRRYGGFFAQLDARGDGAIPRAAAVAFFAKSSLSDAQVAELYERVKGVGLLPDPERVNVAEFTMAMHLIVCITKRNLVRIPPKFPTYLFLTLDLTPAGAKEADEDVWSSASAATTPSAAVSTSTFGAFPSPSPSPSAPSSLLPGVVTGFATMDMRGSNDSYHDTPKLRMEDLSTSSSSLSAALSASKLTDARSLTELVHTEVRHRKAEVAALEKLEHSEARTLQRLHSCLDQIADQVDTLGFPVPTASRTLDALDDLNNLFVKHVHAIKQEIQSAEISAQMMNVASERTESMRGTHEKVEPLKQVAALTNELARLQQEVQTLVARRDALAAEVEAAEAAARSSSAPATQVPTPTTSAFVASSTTPTPTPTPTPSLDAFSTLAQSGGSSTSGVFSATPSVSDVGNETTADDPWASLSGPAAPVTAEPVSTLQDGLGLGLSASLPSPATSSAIADDWGTFCVPPLHQESVAAAAVPTLDAFAAIPTAAAAAADDWGSFGAPTSQQDTQFEAPATAVADKTEATATSASPIEDEWGMFSGPSVPATSAELPAASAADATQQGSDLTLPPSQPPSATSSSIADDWGAFASTPSQQNGSAGAKASADPFGFGSTLASASPGVTASTNVEQPATTAKDDDFGWGNFQ